MIILVVIVVGVIILAVIFRAKKKQQLVVNKLQNVTMESEDTEMKVKQEGTTEKEARSNADQPPYAEIETKVPPNMPGLMECLNQNSTGTGEYDEIEQEPDDGKHALPAKPPRQVNLVDFMLERMQSNPLYQGMNQLQDSPTTTNMPQENDIYTEPDTTSSHTVNPKSGTYETVYSEPIEPSLFTDAVRAPSTCEDLQPYAPIYTIPINLPKSEEVMLKSLVATFKRSMSLEWGISARLF